MVHEYIFYFYSYNLSITITQCGERYSFKVFKCKCIYLFINTRKKIIPVQGPLAVAINEKMFSVLNKNPILNYLKLIKDVYCGINEVLLETEITPWNIANMKIAPISSLEIKRSFS